MRQLILDNKFDDLKEALKSSNRGLNIHKVLLQILNNHRFEDDNYGFEANVYQEDFLEGFDLYKALNKSKIPKKQLEEYRLALTFLIFNMGQFTKLLAKTAMQKGVHLSQVESAYKINPILRNELQNFINLLEETNNVKAIANVAAAKVEITLSIGNLLKRHEVGQDMLQFAISYENVGFKDQAIQVYRKILKDFECEAVRLSNGLFPEVTYVDTRTNEEIEIFELAKKHLEAITDENYTEIKRARIDTNFNAKKLVEKVHSRETPTIISEKKKNTVGFWERLKRLFD